MGGANTQSRMMARMDPITRPLPPPEDYLMQEYPKMGTISDEEMSMLRRMPLFRPASGPTPSISVTPPSEIPMRTTPPTVR